MKHIIKNSEPAEFTQWKLHNPNEPYNNLKGQVKAKLKNSLITEQKSICCYCECFIDSSNSHIEHFKPKDSHNSYSHLQLEYSNLLASCGIRPTGNNDEHCGHKKDNDYCTDLISPLESDCSSHFTYYLDGKIGFKDDRGKKTIQMLHLDSALLNQKRKSLIEYFQDIEDNK